MTDQRAGRSRGFTWIEALVAIAIIVLLVALLIPALHLDRGDPLGKCQSNVKQIAISMLLYGEDWDNYFPLSHYGYPNDGTAGDTKYVDYAVLGDPNATDYLTTRHPDLRHLNPYCNLPQAAVLESEVFELFLCPGDRGPNKRCNPATQDGSVLLTPDYKMSAFERHGSSYTIPLVPAAPSGSSTVPLPDGKTWSFRNTHRNLMGWRTHESGDPVKQVIASDSHCYATSQMPGGAAWNDWAWYGAYHDEQPWNNMGFLDGHVKFTLMRSGAEAWGGKDHEYSFYFIEKK